MISNIRNAILLSAAYTRALRVNTQLDSELQEEDEYDNCSGGKVSKVTEQTIRHDVQHGTELILEVPAFSSPEGCETITRFYANGNMSYSHEDEDEEHDHEDGWWAFIKDANGINDRSTSDGSDRSVLIRWDDFYAA